MSWMTGLGWKEGLSGVQIQKVEELEKSVSRASAATAQKQVQLDGVTQSLEKLKRKNEEDQRDGAGLQLELARSQKSCQELEDKNQMMRTELKSKDVKLSSTSAQLEKTTKQLEQATSQVKRMETERSSTSMQGRRMSVTPHKRESIRIGVSQDSPADPEDRIQELEKQLAEREQETKDLELKLFESSLGARPKFNSFDEEPLPSQKGARQSLFIEEPISAPSVSSVQTPRREDVSRRDIADRYKGSSIAFNDYASSPPVQRRNTRQDSFKTPQLQRRAVSVSDTESLRAGVAREEIGGKDEAMRLEGVLKLKETELQGLRVSLASAESQLEQHGRTGKGEVRGESSSRLQMDLEKQSNKVQELETRVLKVQQEAECKVHNADAARTALEAKLKTQERELRTEAAEATNLSQRLEKQVDDLERKMEQAGKAALLKIGSQTAAMEKAEVAKSAMEKEVSELKCRINQLENTVLSLEKAKEEAEKKATELAREGDTKAARAEQAEGKLAALEKESSAAKKTAEENVAMIQSLKEQLDKNETEVVPQLEALKQDKKAIEDLKTEAETKLEDFKQTNSVKLEKIAEFESASKAAAIHVEAMKAEVEAMKVTVEEAEKEKSEEVQKAGSALAEKLTAEMEQWRLDEESKALKIQVEKQETTEQELRDTIKEKCSVLEKLREEGDNMRISNAQATDSVSQLTESFTELEDKARQLEGQLTEKERLYSGLLEEKRLVREELEKKEASLEALKSDSNMKFEDLKMQLAAVADTKEQMKWEEEVYQLQGKHSEALANLESTALVAVEVQDRLTKEIEAQEFNLKSQKENLAVAVERAEELKKQLDAKEAIIEDMQNISAKNEESHNVHYQEKATELEELVQSVEELSEKLRCNEGLYDTKVAEAIEAQGIVATHEQELERLGRRVEELQQEQEEAQGERRGEEEERKRLRHELDNVRAEKEEVKEWLEVVQGQQDELVRQVEKEKEGRNRAEAACEAVQGKERELKRIGEEGRKRIEEHGARVEALEQEEDRMAACIVELEQRVGTERARVVEREEQSKVYSEALTRAQEKLQDVEKKVEDLDDASAYDKEHILQLEQEILQLKAVRSKLELGVMNRNTTLEKLSGELKALREGLAEGEREEVAKLKQEIDEEREARKKEQKEVRKGETNLQKLKSRLETAESQLEAKGDEVSDLQDQWKAMEVSIDVMTREIKEQDAQFLALKQERLEQDEWMVGLQREKDQADTEKEAQEALLHAEEFARTALEARVLSLTEESQVFEAERERLLKTVTELREALRVLQSQLEDKMGHIQQEMMTAKFDTTEKEVEITTLMENIASITSEKEIFKQRVVQMELNLKSKDGEFESRLSLEMEPLKEEIYTVQLNLSAKMTEIASLQNMLTNVTSEREVVEQTNIEHIKIKENEIAALKENIASLLSTSEILKQKVVELESDIKLNEDKFESKISLRLNPVENQMKAVHLDLSEKVTELESLQNMLITTTEEKEHIHQKLTGKITESEMEICDLRENIASVVAETEFLKHKVVELTSDLEIKEDEFETKLAMRLEPLQKDMTFVQLDLSEKVKELESVQNMLTTISTNKEDLEQKLSEHITEREVEISALRENLASGNSEMEILKHEVVRLTSDLKIKGEEFESVIAMKMDPVQKEVETKTTEISTLKKSITDFSSEKAILKQKVVQLESDLQLKEQEFESAVSMQLEPLQQEIEAKVTELATLRETISSVASEKDVLIEKVVRLESDMNVKEQEFESLISMTVQPMKIEIEKKTTELVTLKEDIGSVVSEKDILKQKVVQLKSDLKVKEQEFESTMSMTLKPMQEEIETKVAEIVSLRENIESVVSEKEMFKETIEQLEKDLKLKEEDVESRISLTLEPLEKEMKTVQLDFTTKVVELAALQEIITVATTEKEILKQKLVELETNIKAKEEDFESEIHIRLEPIEREMKAVRMDFTEKETKLIALQETMLITNSEKEILKQKVVTLESDLKIKEEQFAVEIQLKLEPLEKEKQASQADVAAEKEEVCRLKDLLEASQTAVAESKELLLVIEEKESVEQELRLQVQELREVVSEQTQARESVGANLEVMRREAEQHKEQSKSLQGEVRDASQMAQMRLEKCKMVEVQLEEVTREKEEQGGRITSLEKEQERLEQEVQLTTDKLASSQKLSEDLQVQLTELELKQNNDLKAEKEMIQQQFETMTKNFEEEKDILKSSMTKELDDQTSALEKSKIDLTDCEQREKILETSSQQLTAQVTELQQDLTKLSKEHEVVVNSVDTLKQSEMELMQKLEEIRSNSVTAEKHTSVKALLTSTIEECDILKEKKMAIQAQAIKAEKASKAVEKELARQTKHVTELRTELSRHQKEAESASSNPWESPDWEGLSSTEIWDVLKPELVPAQQARILKLCLEQLEKELNDSKKDFLKAVVEVSSVMEEKTKLEAKICVLESGNVKPEKKVEEELEHIKCVESKKDEVKEKKPLVAAPRFTAPVAPVEKSSSGRNLRRSSRSASTVASALLTTMEELREEPGKRDIPAEEKPGGKKEPAQETIKEKEDVKEISKEAVKEKKRLISPEKKKVVGKKMKPSASPTKAVQREVLAPLTNSPRKSVPAAPTAKTPSTLPIRSLRATRETRKTRNPEECKQQ